MEKVVLDGEKRPFGALNSNQGKNKVAITSIIFIKLFLVESQNMIFFLDLQFSSLIIYCLFYEISLYCYSF